MSWACSTGRSIALAAVTTSGGRGFFPRPAALLICEITNAGALPQSTRSLRTHAPKPSVPTNANFTLAANAPSYHGERGGAHPRTCVPVSSAPLDDPVSYTHLRAHETKANLVCRLLLE